MCGIVGEVTWRKNARINKLTLEKMANEVRHRGPDDHGIYIDKVCGLAHCRLSIIDLTQGGHQPMSTPDKRYTIVFNGEIYNFKELQKKFLGNIKLNSASDTEVLLNMLVQQETNAFRELRGMFSLAIWNKQKEELLIARDAYGKKPLYYYKHQNQFIFASEVKSLLAHPSVSASIDPTAITKYLIYEYAPAPATGYQKIKQLPMGSYAHITEHGIKIKQWWKPKYTPKLTFSSEQKALNKLDQLLSQAVQRRMVADVPVGLFLSGGLDSTTIAWYMRQLSNNEVHSFSTSFTEKSFDESSYALAAANSLGTQHHPMHFEAHNVQTTFQQIKHLTDVPLADPIILPTYLLSKNAKKYITVALSGEGSDELLAGYNTFRAAQITHFMPFLSRSFWKPLEKMTQALPTRHTYSTMDSKIKTLLKGMGYPVLIQNQIWIGSFSPEELNHLLTDSFQNNIIKIFEDIAQLTNHTKSLIPIDKISYANIHHYLHNLLLTKLDRSTMYAGLEARAPFLDTDLSQFIMRLPSRLKRDKFLLRKLMRGRIPNEIIDRPKQGFSLPLGHWLRGPLYDWSREILSTNNIQTAGIVRANAVNNLLTEHKQGKADHRKKIWTLITLHLWYKNWITHSKQ